MLRMIVLMLNNEENEADAVANPSGWLARLQLANVRNPDVLAALSRLGLINDEGEVLDASNPLWTPFFVLRAIEAGDSVAKAELVRRASDLSELYPDHWLDVVASLSSTVPGGELVGRLVRSACPVMTLAAVDSLRSAVAYQLSWLTFASGPMCSGLFSTDNSAPWWKSWKPVARGKSVTIGCVTTANDSNTSDLAKVGTKPRKVAKQAKTGAKTQPKSVKPEKSVTKRASKRVTTV